MKVKSKGRKAAKMETVSNEHGKRNSKNVDLSTLSVDDFMNSTFNESEDSDISDISSDNSSNDMTRAMNGDQQEEGMYHERVFDLLQSLLAQSNF
jgi:hypothetical protein